MRLAASSARARLSPMRCLSQCPPLMLPAALTQLKWPCASCFQGRVHAERARLAQQLDEALKQKTYGSTYMESGGVQITGEGGVECDVAVLLHFCSCLLGPDLTHSRP